jgi:hypothetical protein
MRIKRKVLFKLVLVYVISLLLDSALFFELESFIRLVSFFISSKSNFFVFIFRAHIGSRAFYSYISYIYDV